MSSGASSSRSAEADDEFSDGGIDDAAALTLVEAAEKVQAAAEREKKIDGLIADHEAELKEIARLRKQKGSGHPGNSGRMGTTNYKRVSHELSRLKRGKLPGEAGGAPVRSRRGCGCCGCCRMTIMIILGGHFARSESIMNLLFCHS